MYAAGVYSNMGNYKSFGDTKFVPNLPKVSWEGWQEGSGGLWLENEKGTLVGIKALSLGHRVHGCQSAAQVLQMHT